MEKYSVFSPLPLSSIVVASRSSHTSFTSSSPPTFQLPPGSVVFITTLYSPLRRHVVNL